MIDSLPLSDHGKDFLHYRWLDQVTWMDGASSKAGRRYNALRLIAIVGGVLVPTLVSWTPPAGWDDYVRGAAIVLSLLVAITTAIEEFFHFGEKWRHYRHTSEQLKSEGWQFFALTGPYRRFDTHEAAFQAFAGRVEEAFRREVDVYIREIVREDERDKAQVPAPRGPAAPAGRT